MKVWKIIFMLLMSFGISTVALAQGPVSTPSDDEVNRIAKNLYCPVCENIPLDTCETKACKDWREEIRLKLSEGWSDQQIYDFFVEQHGDRVLASPPARGLNLLVYIVPPLLILAGLVLLAKVLKGSITNKPPVPDQTSPADSLNAEDEEYISKLEEELDQRE